jgi:hypothetical protein
MRGIALALALDYAPPYLRRPLHLEEARQNDGVP